MKLSKLGDVIETCDRRDTVACVLKALVEPDTEITLVIDGQKEMVSRELAPKVVGALEAYFGDILKELDGNLEALGVSIDEAPVA